MKKTAHKKRTTASSNPAPDDEVDNPDFEDDVEASHADVAEIIILSSDSETLPSQKIRQANRKVKFSHPLAYLDPKLLMKTQQH